MFGDQEIFGISELSIDKKGRIFIPTSTKRETGEELVLLYNNNLKLHEIYSAKRLGERFEELNKLIANSKTNKERIFYEKRLLNLSKSVLKSSNIDSQGRMLIGKVFEECDKLTITGAYDHLIVEPLKKRK